MLHRSRFVHVIEVHPDCHIIGHAINGVRWTVRPEVRAVIDAFSTPTEAGSWAAEQADGDEAAEADLLATIAELEARGFLHDVALGDEVSIARARLQQHVLPNTGPNTQLETRGSRRPQWTLDVPAGVRSRSEPAHRMMLVVMGACDVQLVIDLLRDGALDVGIHLDALATASADFALLRERQVDAILIGPNQFFNELFTLRHPGASRDRGADSRWNGNSSDLRPRDLGHLVRAGLTACRLETSCPILLLNLPSPSSSPYGIADRGRDHFVNMAREANLAIADIAGEFEDVFVIDVDNLYSRYGKDRLLDDAVYVWEHLGSTTSLRDLWLSGELPPEVERLDPRGQLATARPSEVFEFERLLAAEVLRVLVAIRGIGRKKLIVCDLDDTLWPGVLAETESPFGGEPITWHRSAMSMWLGIHQALRAVMQRGVLLACCSKNDEVVVRKYWRYPPGSADFLLGLDDFVTHRINWEEKTVNLRSIADELGVGLDAIVFIDDNPVERDKVERCYPQVTVLGENLFEVRSQLLSMATLEVPFITPDAGARTAMVKAQLEQRAQLAVAATMSGDDYLRTLQIEIQVGRVSNADVLDRIHELVIRTNQFNTTGHRFSKNEIRAYLQADGSKSLHAMRVTDRFGARGLVGACFTTENHIDLFVMSCRVIGMGAEQVMLSSVLDSLSARYDEVAATFVPTDRNVPARDLYRRAGFSEAGDGTTWIWNRAGDNLVATVARDIYKLSPFDSHLGGDSI